MDELTSRFRTAYDTLMEQQPDPPEFDEIAHPMVGDSSQSQRARRTPALAFAGGIAAVAALALVLWMSGAWTDPLPPTLDSAGDLELEWREDDVIGDEIQRVEFATGNGGVLALAFSWSESLGERLDGVYQSEAGVVWKEVDTNGLDGIDHFVSLGTTGDGFVAWGLYREGDGSRPALWRTADGIQWDLTLLPLPDEEPGSVVNYGVGLVALDSDRGVALGQFVVNRPAEDSPEFDSGPRFDEEGNPLPPDQGTFVWETNASGEWGVADSAPSNPLWLADGPAGPIVLARGEDGTEVWRTDGEAWARVAVLPSRADFPEAIVVGNEDGYLAVFQNGDTWFSPTGGEWTATSIPTQTPGLAVAGPGGYLVTSRESSEMFWSIDGREWTTLRPSADHGEDITALIAANVGERAISLAISTGSGESIRRYVVTGTAAP